MKTPIELAPAPFIGLSLAGLLVLAPACRHPSADRMTVVSDTEVPESWQAAAVETNAPPVRWWESFGDDRLNRLVEESLEENRDLRVASARVDAAMAEVRIAGADLSPQLNAGLEGRRDKRNFIGFPIPGGGSRVLSSHSTSYGLNLNLSWEVDLWGRMRAGRRAAEQDFLATGAELEAARLSLAGQTVKAWLAVAAAGRQLAVAEETVETYRLMVEQVRRRYENGLGSSLDWQLSLTSLSSAEALLEERRVQRERAVRQLELLLARYPAGELEGGQRLPEVPPVPPAGLPAGVLARRADLFAAERRVLAADARLAQAKASLYPRISLTTQGGTSSSELSDLLSSDFTIWTLAANFAQPILDGGRLRAGVDLAGARVRESLESFQAALLRAFGEVESALVAGEILARREEGIVLNREQTAEALRLASERYRSGLEPFTTVLEAQQRSLNAESQWVRVRLARLENRVDLHLALGGGFDDDPAAAGRETPVDDSGGNEETEAGL